MCIKIAVEDESEDDGFLVIDEEYEEDVKKEVATFYEEIELEEEEQLLPLDLSVNRNSLKKF